MGKKQLKDPKEAADMATAEMLRRTHHSRAWYRVIAGRANKGGSKVPFYNKPKVGQAHFLKQYYNLGFTDPGPGETENSCHVKPVELVKTC